VLRWLPTSRNSLTASCNCGLSLEIAVHPGSSPPVVVEVPRRSMALEVLVSFRPSSSSMSVFVVPSQHGHTEGQETALPVNP
jgi:hypothetical protein